MRPVRPGGQFVDDGGVAGVPAALLALPVAVGAAPLAKEIAFETLAVGAASAAALGDVVSPALST